MGEIQYDPACVDCRRDAGKDLAGTTWQCNGHVRAERDWLRAKLANVMVEWDHDVEVLTKERNAALTLAEQRGAAYDMAWREVESLRERLDAEEEERWRQYGLRVEAEQATEQAWADVLSALRVAFGEDRPYDESPTELIVQLADERDEARADTEAMQVYGQEQRDRAIAAERERDEARALAVSWEREFNVANHERLRLWDEAESFCEKLDQFEANGFPNVASVLDRIAALSRARETEPPETPGTNKVEASDGGRDYKGTDRKQDGRSDEAHSEDAAVLGVQPTDGSLADGVPGGVPAPLPILRGGAADRSVVAREPEDGAVREAAEVRKHRTTLLSGLAYIARESWWPDDASVTDGVRDHVGKMRDAVDALSSPPRPETKDDDKGGAA